MAEKSDYLLQHCDNLFYLENYYSRFNKKLMKPLELILYDEMEIIVCFWGDLWICGNL